ELHVHAQLAGQAPGVAQVQVGPAERAARLRVEEMGVVDAHADIRLHRAVGQEMPLQAQGGRQVLGGADLAQAAAAPDIVLEGPGAEQLDADVPGGHVCHAETGADVAADVQVHAAAQHAAVV